MSLNYRFPGHGQHADQIREVLDTTPDLFSFCASTIFTGIGRIDADTVDTYKHRLTRWAIANKAESSLPFYWNWLDQIIPLGGMTTNATKLTDAAFNKTLLRDLDSTARMVVDNAARKEVNA